MFKLLTATMTIVLVIGAASRPANAQHDTYPNKVKSHIGELTFDHGVPTEETSKKLYYEMDYHRAVQTYLWALPIMGQAQWRQAYLDQYNMKPNQSVYATNFNERSRILTANESTPSPRIVLKASNSGKSRGQ